MAWLAPRCRNEVKYPSGLISPCDPAAQPSSGRGLATRGATSKLSARAASGLARGAWVRPEASP
eukprot:1263501-Pyramimonas_sp.AAC.1